MNESSIAKIKYLIRRADTSELAKMLSSVDLTDPDMIRKTFGEYAERIMKDSAEEK
jgi:signal transduction protein with GAF and PtsI domain